MSRRRNHKTRRAIALYLLALVLIVIVALGETIYRTAGYIIVTATIAILAYCEGRYRLTNRLMRPLRTNARYAQRGKKVREMNARSAYPAELTALNKEIARLRTELENAHNSARAAWEDSAEPADTKRQAIINDPRSGVNPLTPEV